MRLHYMALVLMLLLTGCGKPAPTKEERAFVKGLQSQLQNLGDSDRVQDDHGGEWLKVCVHPLGTHSTLEALFVEKVGILNGRDTYADDETWGLYFVHPDNVIEYYNIPASEMMVEAPADCVDRDKARFEVVANAKNRDSAPLSPGVNYSENFVYLRLVSP